MLQFHTIYKSNENSQIVKNVNFYGDLIVKLNAYGVYCNYSDFAYAFPIYEEGIYTCEVQGIKCLLFYWKNSRNRYKGIVVSINSQKDLQIAFNFFNNKVIHTS